LAGVWGPFTPVLVNVKLPHSVSLKPGLTLPVPGLAVNSTQFLILVSSGALQAVAAISYELLTALSPENQLNPLLDAEEKIM
jgi:hypothetical protein